MTVMRNTLLAAAALSLLALLQPADAQTPKRGGTMTLATDEDPPNYDCGGGASTITSIFLSPIYSRLVRFDLENYPSIVGDAAESWTVSPDGLTYTFKIRPNIHFHDGSILTSADVKASYDRYRNPPPGVLSLRKPDFQDVASVEAPDPSTLVLRLTERNGAILPILAYPFVCIYSARRIADDPNFPVTNLMGSGPFMPGEIIRGTSWTTKRFDNYFRAGLPYLDGFKWVIIAPVSQVNAIVAGQIDGITRTMTPQEIEIITKARGDKVQVKSKVLINMNNVTFNLKRKPFDDIRVRRALTLALDRRNGLEPMKKLSNAAAFGTLMRPGSPMELPDDEKAKLPGFGLDPAAAKAEARRLLAEAGQSDLKFKLNTQPALTSWMNNALFAIDQWRQIGVIVEANVINQSSAYTGTLAKGDFDVALDGNNVTSDDPIMVLQKFTPNGQNNYAGITDPLLGELYRKQKDTLDVAARTELVHSFEKRVLEQVYTAPLFWAGWSLPWPRELHGMPPTPAYHVGYDFAEVWRE